MNANLERVKGRQVLTVFYDSTTCDWDNRIAAALAAYNIDHHAVIVIAEPRRTEGETNNPTKGE
jgi:hypothetical protein